MLGEKSKRESQMMNKPLFLALEEHGTNECEMIGAVARYLSIPRSMSVPTVGS